MEAAYEDVLPEETKVARTIEVSESIMVDLDAEGRPVGIEWLVVSSWTNALVALAIRGKLVVK